MEYNRTNKFINSQIDRVLFSKFFKLTIIKIVMKWESTQYHSSEMSFGCAHILNGIKACYISHWWQKPVVFVCLVTIHDIFEHAHWRDKMPPYEQSVITDILWHIYEWLQHNSENHERDHCGKPILNNPIFERLWIIILNELFIKSHQCKMQLINWILNSK